MKRKLPIGISDFKTVREGNYVYVDKSLLIQEIVDRGDQVFLLPRPRRFGKTLNLSMLRYFFEKTKMGHRSLFKGLNIWKQKRFRDLQGKFPVIFLTLKDIKFSSWEETWAELRRLIAQEFKRHQSLLRGHFLTTEEKKEYRTILNNKGSATLYRQSLGLLTEWLTRAYKQKAILLIDEYDTPAHAASLGGYYDTFIEFLRNWLSAGLKDNPHLGKGVLTGILRIAKESVFSGLNNISTFTIVNEEFQDKFGLLEEEVKKLLKEFDLLKSLPAMRKWYDGYQIGSCKGIYNPWSVLQCIAKQGALAPYWVNTSDNALMKSLIAQGTEDLKADVEALLNGKTIEKPIEEGTIFSELQYNTNLVWSLLLFSGYVTVEKLPSYRVPAKLRIPNNEVKVLYQSMVLDWFDKALHTEKYRQLLRSLTTGEIETFSRIFQDFMLASTSVFDVPEVDSEKIYHAFVLGLLVGLQDTYEVKSNRESGYGRYDVMLIPKDPKALGIVMEFKKRDRYSNDDLEATVQSALKQIEDKKYAHELQQRGIKRILKLAFAFEGKQVLIRSHLSKR